MKSYHQYCPVARAAEIFAERWTPVILRNLSLGCDTIAAIAAGAPGMPRSLLRTRLVELEAVRIVERTPKAAGRGWQYRLTPAGAELMEVCLALGAWGAHWLEVAPQHLDPYVLLWGMAATADRERLPSGRLVLAFTFVDQPVRYRYFWLLVEHGAVEVCVHHPGGEEDLVITTDAQALVHWHLGRLAWREAVGTGRIALTGAANLVRAFPTWFPLNYFAQTAPAASQILVPAGG